MTTPSTLHPKDRGSVRANDPITSQWAADSIADATTSQDFVLMVLRDFTRPGPFTLAHVVANTAGVLSPSRARTAVRELQDKGLIEETGTEPSGAILYRTTGEFLEYLGVNSLEDLPPLAPYLPDATVLDDIENETIERSPRCTAMSST